EAIELQQNRKPDERLQHEKSGGGGDRHLSRRNRARTRALDPCVEVAIDDIVPGAARPAHGEGADEEEGEVPDIDPAAGVNCGESGGPPTRPQEQPGTDWPVEAREPQVRT